MRNTLLVLDISCTWIRWSTNRDAETGVLSVTRIRIVQCSSFVYQDYNLVVQLFMGSILFFYPPRATPLPKYVTTCVSHAQRKG